MLPVEKFNTMYNGVEPVGLDASKDVLAKIESTICCRGHATALRDDDDLIVHAHELQTSRGPIANVDASSTSNMNQLVTLMMTIC